MNRTRILLAASLVLLLGAGFLSGLPRPTSGAVIQAGVWMETSTSISRQNLCHQSQTCVEWCVHGASGLEETGELCCVANGDVGSEDPYACIFQ